MNWTEYNGWSIRAHWQTNGKFVAYARRPLGSGKVEMFNVEGDTLEQAVARIKQAVNEK